MKIEYELGNKFTGFDWVSCPQGCIVKRISPYDGKEYNINMDITQTQYTKWCNGELIQNAMPHLTPDEREFILTGLTAEQFNKLYGEEE